MTNSRRSLEQEIAALEEQRKEVDGRLRELSHGGRGRGAGRGQGPPGRGRLMGRGAGGFMGGRGEGRPPPRDQYFDVGRGQGAPPPVAHPELSRKVMSSVVASSGVVHTLEPQVQEPSPRQQPGPAKRPAPSEDDNPMAKKRNRRMFGALLGTLQRFKDEDAQFKASDVAAKRQQALKKAEAKSIEVSQELRSKAREERDSQLKEEMDLRQRILAKTEEKALQLMHTECSANRKLLANFIRTKASPPIMYLPAKHTPETRALLEESGAGYLAWQRGADEELKKKIAELREAAAIAAPTRTSLEEGRGGGARGGSGEEKEEGEIGEGGEAEAPADPPVKGAGRRGADMEEEEDGGEMEVDGDDNPEGFEELLG